MMDSIELTRHLKTGEGIGTEFKRCGGTPEHDTYESICSFANRQGGNIFLGVADDGTVLGVPPKSALNIQRALVNATNNPKLFNVAPLIETETIEVDSRMVIRVWVPMGPAVYSYKGVIFDRIADADVRVSGVDRISLLYLRKQNIYSERRIYKYVDMGDFREDTITKARKLALSERDDHPWKSLTNEEILHTSGLYSRDRQTGETGFTLAAILLFGSDDLIADVCPAYRTEGILRQENLDRYDDRITLNCNLIDAYDELIAFAKRHTDDRFILEGDRRVSARDIIIRELVGNLMIHREFMSPFPAQLVIERSRIYTRNASKALYEGTLSLSDFSPVPKNPTIAGIFRTIGRAEELGSGMRNLEKYSRLYSGKPARLTDGDVFYAEVPLTPVVASQGERGIRNAIEVLARRDGSVASDTLAAYLGVSTRTAQRHLKRMLEAGYVTPLTGAHQHRYVPQDGLVEHLE